MEDLDLIPAEVADVLGVAIDGVCSIGPFEVMAAAGSTGGLFPDMRRFVPSVPAVGV